MKIFTSLFLLFIFMFQVNILFAVMSSQNEYITQDIEFEKIYPQNKILKSPDIHFFDEESLIEIERKNIKNTDNQKLAQEPYTIGDIREFWARDADSESDEIDEISYKTSATLVAISDNALIYAESPTKFSGTDNLGNILAN